MLSAIPDTKSLANVAMTPQLRQRAPRRARIHLHTNTRAFSPCVAPSNLLQTSMSLCCSSFSPMAFSTELILS